MLFLSSVGAVAGAFVRVARTEEVIFAVVSLAESGSMWGGHAGRSCSAFPFISAGVDGGASPFLPGSLSSLVHCYFSTASGGTSNASLVFVSMWRFRVVGSFVVGRVGAVGCCGVGVVSFGAALCLAFAFLLVCGLVRWVGGFWYRCLLLLHDHRTLLQLQLYIVVVFLF